MALEHDPAHRNIDEPHMSTDYQMPLASSSSKQQQAPQEKSVAVVRLLAFDNTDVSPNHYLKNPHSLSLPLSAHHQSTSTLQASSALQAEVKNLENGSGSSGPGEGADEDEKKQHVSHKKRSKNWTRPESLLLIRLRTQLEPRFAKSGRKTELWDEIAECLQKENYTRDAQQCRDKWEKLIAGYKEVQDGIKEKECNPLYEELHLLLSGKSLKRDREKEKKCYSKEQERERELPKGSTQDTIMEEAKLDLPQTSEMQHEEDEEGEDELEPARKKSRGGTKYIPVTDVETVRTVLETVITRQQNFFRELLDAMERKEQMREQMRQEKEDKWRAEERAQRGVFNNAMIFLTQKLVGEQIGASLPPAPLAPPPAVKAEPPAPAMGNPEGHQGAPKRRSKNWKRAEVLQLIKLRGEMGNRFAHSTRRATLWNELAEHLLGQGIKRDGKQCREKWDKLMAKYKDITDGKRDQRESPYYAELTAILGQPVEAA